MTLLSCLYAMTSRILDTPTNFFFSLMDPDNLIVGVEVMLLGICVIVISIYAQLARKKNIYRHITGVRNHLEVWISHMILEESSEAFEVPPKFQRMLDHKWTRQHVIDALIDVKKNLSGTVADNITQLYLQLGLKKDTLAKFRNTRSWHVKARGIQELYLMDQKDLLTTIYKNTNARNEFVRMEAQIGVIQMTGFAGLRFLDVVSYPITEWQQIKLLEKLRRGGGQPENLSESINNWLRSKNDTVVAFALKLAAEYQQFSSRDQVTDILVHPNELVRAQGIKTLLRLADQHTPVVLLGYFPKERFANRTLILDALAHISTAQQVPTLTEILDDPDNIIKLKAAVALAQCCPEGMEILEKRAAVEKEPFERILMHVKSVA
jgi:hypothetical protein